MQELSVEEVESVVEGVDLSNDPEFVSIVWPVPAAEEAGEETDGGCEQ